MNAGLVSSIPTASPSLQSSLIICYPVSRIKANSVSLRKVVKSDGYAIMLIRYWERYKTASFVSTVQPRISQNKSEMRFACRNLNRTITGYSKLHMLSFKEKQKRFRFLKTSIVESAF